MFPCWQYLLYILFTMGHPDLNAKLLIEMLGKMLRTIDGTMLTTRTAEAEHQMGEATLDITSHMLVGQRIDMVEELKDLSVILQESDYRFVEAR